MTGFICSECNKSFTLNKNLKKHLQKFHPGNVVIKERVFQHTCDLCSRRYNSIHHFNRHKRLAHNIDESKRKLICPLCQKRFITRDKILNHFKDDHEIEMKEATINFCSETDFLQWKEKIERETRTFFARKCTNMYGMKITYYNCHRSGMYTPKGSGLRRLKVQGSNKIGGYCPAQIRLFQKSDVFEAKYFETHIGHQNDFCHIMLTENEKRHFADLISKNMSFEEILDEVKNDVSGSSLYRRHLLTKKDLFNIEQIYKLKGQSKRCKSDTVINVDSWIEEMKLSDKKTILYHKPKNSKCSIHPELKYDDFILIIMNKAQQEILNIYGNEFICLDNIHGVNGYDFEMTTLIVLDNLKQGFPCAICFSSRVDEEIVSLFLSYIKKEVGNINCNTFMSDMPNLFYNSWIKLMGKPNFQLFSSWHIDDEWRNNIKMINSTSKQLEIYKLIKTMMYSTEQNKFKEIFEASLQLMLADSDMKTFGEYFLENFSKNTQCWASCYRLHLDENTNAHLERIHETIKYIYLQGKTYKRLDKTLSTLMKYIREKMFDRVVTLNKGTLSSELNVIRNRHKISMDLNCEVEIIESERKWSLLSLTFTEICTINKEDIDCACKLVCADCEVCIHRFKCSCIDSSIKWNMCKHIHFLNRYLKYNIKDPVKKMEEDGITNLEIFIDNKYEIRDVSEIINVISVPDVQESIDRERNVSLEKLDDVHSSISDSTSLETIDTLHRDIDSIKPPIETNKIKNKLATTTATGS